MSASPSGTPIPCPACGAPASGRFCAECGAAVRGATCSACRSILSPGARFCHRCGAAVGTAVAAANPGAPAARAAAAPQRPAPGAGAVPLPADAGSRSVLPWTFLGLTVVALLVILVAQRSGTTEASTMGDAPFAGSAGGGAAPDISSMSPRERANRLFDHIMRLASEGKQDSVSFFAPMALSAYEVLGQMDNDLRYDYGRIAEVSGNLEVAQAEADTILKASPNHLLGLILASRVAGLKGDRVTQQALEKRLLAAETSEKQKALPEYQLHDGDIEAAIVQASGARKP